MTDKKYWLERGELRTSESPVYVVTDELLSELVLAAAAAARASDEDQAGKFLEYVKEKCRACPVPAWATHFASGPHRRTQKISVAG